MKITGVIAIVVTIETIVTIGLLAATTSDFEYWTVRAITGVLNIVYVLHHYQLQHN
jgi:hypothetical protein